MGANYGSARDRHAEESQEHQRAARSRNEAKTLRRLRNRQAARVSQELRDSMPELVAYLVTERRAMGYEAAAKAILEVTAEDIIQRIKAAQLGAAPVQTPAQQAASASPACRCPTCGATLRGPLVSALNAETAGEAIAPLNSTNAGEGL